MPCYQKCNRLIKVNKDIVSVRRRLIDERESIQADLKSLFGARVAQKSGPSTPNSAVKPEENKRLDLVNSSEKKTFAKANDVTRKILPHQCLIPLSPQLNEQQVADSGLGCSPLRLKVTSVNKSTQTPITREQSQEPGVKIVTQFPTSSSTRLIKDEDNIRILKALASSRNITTIANHMLTAVKYHNILFDQFCKQLAAEAKAVCSSADKSMLQDIQLENIMQFKRDVIAEDLRLRCPLIFKSLEAITGKNGNSAVVPACISLFARNKNMCLFQHVTGQLLDNDVPTDKTIEIFNGLGLSVSPSSVYKKKKDLAAWGQKKQNSIVDTHHKAVHTNQHREMTTTRMEEDTTLQEVMDKDTSTCTPMMSSLVYTTIKIEPESGSEDEHHGSILTAADGSQVFITDPNSSQSQPPYPISIVNVTSAPEHVLEPEVNTMLITPDVTSGDYGQTEHATTYTITLKRQGSESPVAEEPDTKRSKH